MSKSLISERFSRGRTSILKWQPANTVSFPYSKCSGRSPSPAGSNPNSSCALRNVPTPSFPSSTTHLTLSQSQVLPILRTGLPCYMGRLPLPRLPFPASVRWTPIHALPPCSLSPSELPLLLCAQEVSISQGPATPLFLGVLKLKWSSASPGGSWGSLPELAVQYEVGPENVHFCKCPGAPNAAGSGSTFEDHSSGVSLIPTCLTLYVGGTIGHETVFQPESELVWVPREEKLGLMVYRYPRLPWRSPQLPSFINCYSPTSQL